MTTSSILKSSVRNQAAEGGWLSPSRAWVLALAVVVGITVLRLVYLAFLCPYTLVEDEAFYWEWSRRLAASYYTKGPGIAWTIAGSTAVLGDTAFAVRAPAAIFAGLSALVIALLTRDLEAGRPSRSPLIAAVAFLCVPMYQIMGLLMTIDGPYAACWITACWTAWRALTRCCRSAWLLLGLLIGVGFLYKYTILLLIPSLVIFAVVARRELRMHRWSGLLGLGGGVLMLGCFLPVLHWNSAQNWPTLAHLLGHLGVKGGDVTVTQGGGQGWNYSPKWTLDFVGGQIGMVGPLIVVMALATIRVLRGRAAAPAGDAAAEATAQRTDDATASATSRLADVFLVCCMLPLVTFYLLTSLLTEPEGNWTLAAYLTGCVLAARLIDRVLWPQGRMGDEGMTSGTTADMTPGMTPGLTAWVTGLWRAAVVVGIAVTLAIPRLDLIHRVVQPIYEKIAGGTRRPLIPIGRFTGADAMAAHTARLIDQLEDETGLEPIVIAVHYGRAAQLAFYMNAMNARTRDGAPVQVAGATSLMDGRRTQYDFWPDTDLRDTRRWAGRPAVLVGEQDIEKWKPVFERVERVGRLDGDSKINKDGSPSRPAYLAYGFRGFPAAIAAQKKELDAVDDAVLRTPPPEPGPSGGR